MNTIDCIKSRRSVRKFTEEKVPHEVLEQLVELARWAPSWKNTQIARYVAVEDEALKNRIAEEATIPWNEGIIKGAPVLMVMTYVEKRCGYERDGSFSTSKGDRWQNFDCGIAAATFELAAHELGLGSGNRCFCGVKRRTRASVVSNFSCDSFIKGNPWHNCGLH